MKKFRCEFCTVKRPAGELYIVNRIAVLRLICRYCVEDIGRTVTGSSKYPRFGADGKSYSDKFINEERLEATHGAQRIAALRKWSEA